MAGRVAPLTGLSQTEMSRVRQSLGPNVPAAYAAFLTVAGAACGSVWQGTDWGFPAILTLRSAAQRLLHECNDPFRLTENDTVISMHQGYQFLFISGNVGDPPVMSFDEDWNAPKQISPSFTDLIIDRVQWADSTGRRNA